MIRDCDRDQEINCLIDQNLNSPTEGCQLMAVCSNDIMCCDACPYRILVNFLLVNVVVMLVGSHNLAFDRSTIGIS